ncbi:hypothetical protein [Enhydrobacter sp.]|jgi:hypothetical protein|uniref:hypothetical protein n=1 Tax=Enhydrobacter sp. TaxID=1894999 RepID=UPI0026326EBF|nr:hypothetical protein [Enhydrobacter sp.]WIM11799.1 MAG: hypothetical protein OJF58_002758 [Enhydrobacter sp.]
MALRPEYSLGHSQYNEFLFAAIGEEKTGPLTVLSALTRLGFDPWQEAARLADLPRNAAIRSFAGTIAGLPEGNWTASDATAIAARLVAWLPAGSVPPIPTLKDAPLHGGPRHRSGLATWTILTLGVLFVAALYAAMHF